MADALDGHHFTLVSYTEGHRPVGVIHARPAGQIVYVGAPIHNLSAQRVGEDTYRLSVGGYPYVGVDAGKLVADLHQANEKIWKITHHTYQNAYTIALADKPHLGWTVSDGAGPRNDVVIAPIISTGSLPPQFSPKQLFLVKPGGE